jgi:hypothetical protein
MSYYQFILSLPVLAGARRVIISSKKIFKANSKGNESVYRASSIYWLSRLSCCLQKSIVASIVNRSKLINGDMVLHNPKKKIINLMFVDELMRQNFILESGFRHY